MRLLQWAALRRDWEQQLSTISTKSTPCNTNKGHTVQHQHRIHRAILSKAHPGNNIGRTLFYHIGHTACTVRYWKCIFCTLQYQQQPYQRHPAGLTDGIPCSTIVSWNWSFFNGLQFCWGAKTASKMKVNISAAAKIVFNRKSLTPAITVTVPDHEKPGS